jgi:SAM-dependent methyltransferase
MSRERYTTQFYSERDAGSLTSAKTVLSLLYRFYQPRSVIDVGCGRGTWLAAAESLGSVELKGVDGAWGQQLELASRNIEFEPVDFEQGFGSGSGYDLCISVEVAEHISQGRAKQFIESLCRRSDVIVFSAAIPDQGGTHHVNEQWPSYWIRLFDQQGYDCRDVFRRQIWSDTSVDWWYRQNVFLFVRRGSPKLDLSLLADAEPMPDVVHPANYHTKIRGFRDSIQQPSLRFCVQLLRRYVGIKVRRLLGSTRS